MYFPPFQAPIFAANRIALTASSEPLPMRIFVLLSRFPYPLEKGDKLRAYHQIKELSKHHEIILCALSDVEVDADSRKELEQYCSHVEVIRMSKGQIYWQMAMQFLTSLKPLQVAYFYNASAKAKIRKLIEEKKPDHLYCQLVRVTEYVKDLSIPKTLDYMDALGTGVERRIDRSPFYMRPLLSMEARRLMRYEQEIHGHFDHLTVISEQDRLLIGLDREITVVPNGVDLEAFKVRTADKIYDLIFTGNMAYPPNVETAVHLVRKIMPIIWKSRPEVTLALVGATPDPKVQALASDRVTVTGWVEDMSAYYAKGKVFIAPMSIGTGLQNKLLEAMAMNLPCITSNLVNNALGAQNRVSVLLGETPVQYASLALSVLNDEGLSQKIAVNGFLHVSEKFTWKGTTDRLMVLMESGRA
jgi:polysaccharide biosynthesis protein PslH